MNSITLNKMFLLCYFTYWPCYWCCYDINNEKNIFPSDCFVFLFLLVYTVDPMVLQFILLQREQRFPPRSFPYSLPCLGFDKKPLLTAGNRNKIRLRSNRGRTKTKTVRRTSEKKLTKLTEFHSLNRILVGERKRSPFSLCRIVITAQGSWTFINIFLDNCPKFQYFYIVRLGKSV
jgi:hypothetical protein